MDNCTIHHVQPVLETFRYSCALHSPDMNPIEEMFSCIKYYLKDYDLVFQAMGDPLPLVEASSECVTKDKCIQWIKHAGYC